ncbi:HU family DNA-binding protein [Mesomycoplasma ovipneumoniae]|uniref:HU family DNA-binding protein n=1 Tax=Mesomycoplasma ovipneumoniae TaxID=29562 RepID=UPI00083E7A97|nr:HU family DNA-binding protein [Mesomycoplasma ovipneumoniae]
MNKKELIEQIANETNLPVKNVELVLNQFFGITADIVKKQGKLVINSFGTFQGVFKPASSSFNPLTKSQITVEAKTTIRFKPSKVLKDYIA